MYKTDAGPLPARRALRYPRADDVIGRSVTRFRVSSFGQKARAKTKRGVRSRVRPARERRVAAPVPERFPRRGFRRVSLTTVSRHLSRIYDGRVSSSLHRYVFPLQMRTYFNGVAIGIILLNNTTTRWTFRS